MKRIVLIDADINLFRVAQQNETKVDWGDGEISHSCNPEHAKHVISESIIGIQKKLDADEYLMCITGDNNFRRTMFPTYKANRTSEKPMGYSDLKQWVLQNFPCKMYDNLEADDVMGIMATKKNPDNIQYVIHSDDKDMRTIPAYLWDRHADKIVKISEQEADRWLYTQVLTGDAVDGYSGCPKIGKKKAAIALAGLSTPLEMRNAVYKLFCKHYKDEELAKKMMLEQCGQARILRASDYNFATKSIKIWNPWEE